MDAPPPPVALLIGSAADAFATLAHTITTTTPNACPHPPIAFYERYRGSTPTSTPSAPPTPTTPATPNRYARWRRWVARDGAPLPAPGSQGLADELRRTQPPLIYVAIPALPIHALPHQTARDMYEAAHALRTLAASAASPAPPVTLLVHGVLDDDDVSDYDALFLASVLHQGAPALHHFRHHLRALLAAHPATPPVWRGALHAGLPSPSAPPALPGFELRQPARAPSRPRKLRTLAGPARILSAAHALPTSGAFLDTYHLYELHAPNPSPRTAAFIDEWQRSRVSLLLQIAHHTFWAFWQSPPNAPSRCAVLHAPPLTPSAAAALDVSEHRRNHLHLAGRSSITPAPPALHHLPLLAPSDLLANDPLLSATSTLSSPDHPPALPFDAAVALLAGRATDARKRKAAHVHRRGKRLRGAQPPSPDHCYPPASVDIALPERQELRLQTPVCRHATPPAHPPKPARLASARSPDASRATTLDSKARRAAAVMSNRALQRSRFSRLQSLRLVAKPGPPSVAASRDTPRQRAEPVPSDRRRGSSEGPSTRTASRQARKAAALEKHHGAVLQALERSKPFFDLAVRANEPLDRRWKVAAKRHCDYGETDWDVLDKAAEVQTGVSSRVHGIEYATDLDHRDSKIMSYERVVSRSNWEFCALQDVQAPCDRDCRKLLAQMEEMQRKGEAYRAKLPSKLARLSAKHVQKSLIVKGIDEEVTLCVEGREKLEATAAEQAALNSLPVGDALRQQKLDAVEEVTPACMPSEGVIQSAIGMTVPKGVGQGVEDDGEVEEVEEDEEVVDGLQEAEGVENVRGADALEGVDEEEEEEEGVVGTEEGEAEGEEGNQGNKEGEEDEREEEEDVSEDEQHVLPSTIEVVFPHAETVQDGEAEVLDEEHLAPMPGEDELLLPMAEVEQVEEIGNVGGESPSFLVSSEDGLPRFSLDMGTPTDGKAYREDFQTLTDGETQDMEGDASMHVPVSSGEIPELAAVQPETRISSLTEDELSNLLYHARSTLQSGEMRRKEVESVLMENIANYS